MDSVPENPEVLVHAPPTELFDNHEGSWEDIQDPSRTPSPLPHVSRALSPARSDKAPRRRKARYRTVFVAQATPTRKTPTPPAQQEQPPEPQAVEVQRALRVVAAFTVRYVGDVLTTAVHLLRKPLGFFLFIWIMAMLYTTLSSAFRTVFAPFCIIPGISRSALCVQPLATSDSRPQIDFQKLMNIESTTFDQLLDESVDTSGLSLQMKKAEIATSDLIVVVQSSRLRSKDLLARTLREFYETGKEAGRGLQTFAAKTGGAVDSIMAIDDYVMQQIDEASRKSWSLSIVWPFVSAPQTKELVLHSFQQTVDVVGTQLQRLIVEAEKNVLILDRLEQILITLHEIVTWEDDSITKDHEELLASLWTMLGGNKAELRSQKNHRSLLQNLSAYRKRALAHVVAALHTLRTMSADVEELRQKVAKPELMGADVPVEVHMKSIRSGIERLQKGKMKAQERQAQVVYNIVGAEDRPVLGA